METVEGQIYGPGLPKTLPTDVASPCVHRFREANRLHVCTACVFFVYINVNVHVYYVHKHAHTGSYTPGVCTLVLFIVYMYVHVYGSGCCFTYSSFQVSLRPAFSSLKLGSGSSRHQFSQSSDKGPPAAEGPRDEAMSHVPRTRDDSSDEEDNVHVKGGHGK